MAFYVRLSKLRDDSATARYSFCTDGRETGEAVIDKRSGQVTVTRGLVGTLGEAIAMRASAKLRTESRRGAMPDAAEWAS